MHICVGLNIAADTAFRNLKIATELCAYDLSVHEVSHPTEY